MNIFKSGQSESHQKKERTNIFKDKEVSTPMLTEPEVLVQKRNIFKSIDPTISEEIANASSNNQVTKSQIEELKHPDSDATRSSSIIKNKKKYTFFVVASLLLLFIFYKQLSTPTHQINHSNNAQESDPPRSDRSFERTPTSSSSQANVKLVYRILDASQNDPSVVNSSLDELGLIPGPIKGIRSKAREQNAKGLAAIKNQDYEASIEAFKSGLESDPSDIEVMNNLAFALYKNGRFSQAKEVIESTLVYAPRRVSAWVNLGDILYITGDSDRGTAAYLTAFRFTSKKAAFIESIERQVEQEHDPKIRDFYVRLLPVLHQHSNE